MFLWLLLTFLRTLYGFLRTKSCCFRTFLVFSELVPELFIVFPNLFPNFLACVSELVPERFIVVPEPVSELVTFSPKFP